MGVYTFTIVDETSAIAPSKLYNALCIDNHNVVPKVVPNIIKSIDFVEGDSTSIGCVKQYNFAEGSPYKYTKDKITELDADNYYFKFTNFEGETLGDMLEYIVYEVKVESNGSGSHFKIFAYFHTKGDVVVTEGDTIVKGIIQSFLMVFKAVEEYLCKDS
ncbi:unnamed protein product [Amaranthus hypochondriacus]